MRIDEEKIDKYVKLMKAGIAITGVPSTGVEICKYEYDVEPLPAYLNLYNYSILSKYPGFTFHLGNCKLLTIVKKNMKHIGKIRKEATTSVSLIQEFFRYRDYDESLLEVITDVIARRPSWHVVSKIINDPLIYNIFMGLVFGKQVASVKEAVARATQEILNQDMVILAKEKSCYSASQINNAQIHAASLAPDEYMAVGTKPMLGFFLMSELEFIPEEFFNCIKWHHDLFECVVNVQELRRIAKNEGLTKERFEEILGYCKFEYPEYRITLTPGLSDE